MNKLFELDLKKQDAKEKMLEWKEKNGGKFSTALLGDEVKRLGSERKSQKCMSGRLFGTLVSNPGFL